MLCYVKRIPERAACSAGRWGSRQDSDLRSRQRLLAAGGDDRFLVALNASALYLGVPSAAPPGTSP